jgi:16S rRNA (adenine1518-N6/adenine1519-N6)-dimethyltransferase
MKGSVLERIAVAASPPGTGLVIEIGPGRGALTEKLLQHAARVVAIEVDAGLVDYLRRRFSSEPRLEIVHGDVLETDLARFGRAAIAGNLPYYIASPILEKTTRLDYHRAVFLIQKEVAERVAAAPGTRDYGLLTIQISLFADVRLLFEVKPSAFRPPPKVDSAVLRLEPHPPLPDIAPDAFLRFAAQCFRQKRKTIRNNLAPVYGKETVEAWPEAGLRAEQIPLEGLLAMFRRVSTVGRTPWSAADPAAGHSHS